MDKYNFKTNEDKRMTIENLMQSEGFKNVGNRTMSGGYIVMTFEPNNPHKKSREDDMLEDAKYAVREITDATCYTVTYPRHGLCVNVMFDPVKESEAHNG